LKPKSNAKPSLRDDLTRFVELGPPERCGRQGGEAGGGRATMETLAQHLSLKDFLVLEYGQAQFLRPTLLMPKP